MPPPPLDATVFTITKRSPRCSPAARNNINTRCRATRESVVRAINNIYTKDDACGSRVFVTARSERKNTSSSTYYDVVRFIV